MKPASESWVVCPRCGEEHAILEENGCFYYKRCDGFNVLVSWREGDDC